MRITRIYHPEILNVGITISLAPSAANHVARVLRLQIGMPIIVFNEQNGEYRGEIIAINKKNVTIHLQNFIETNRESPLTIHLGQSLARHEKMDFIIQKATELGVKEITPLQTEYSQVKLSEERSNKRHARWQDIIISACEQCGRHQLPYLQTPMTFTHWIKQQPDLRLIFIPQATMQLTQLQDKPQRITLVIGPEGGFSETEIQEATQQGFLPINLGPRILRMETAAIAAISMVQMLWGDL